MKIQLNSWVLRDLIFKAKEPSKNESVEEENKFDLSVGHFFKDEPSADFSIGFKISIKEEEYNLNMEFRFYFTTDEIIGNDKKDSDFFRINAPAIAFPYVRSFISTFTLQGGYDPIILPSVNFVAFMKNAEEEKE